MADGEVRPLASRGGRRSLSTGLSTDPQAQIASAHLSSLNQAEHMELNFQLAKLYPSVKNPRRRTLDSAGVTPDIIKKLALQPREPVENWLDRQEAFLASIDSSKEPIRYKVWNELFELAASVLRTELVQPIVAQPTGEIVAGERRWTACQLAGKEFERVIIRYVSDDNVDLMRLVENMQRADLTISETAITIRTIIAGNIEGELGPDNASININLISRTIGCGTTRAASLRSICRLPEGDDILERIYSGFYTNLQAAHHDASARIRQLSALPPKAQVETPPPPPPPEPRLPKERVAKINMPLPGTGAGRAIITALSGIDSLSPETVSRLTAVRNSWEAAPEKSRKRMLAEALDAILKDFKGQDEDE